jgi:hypothetical protein
MLNLATILKDCRIPSPYLHPKKNQEKKREESKKWQVTKCFEQLSSSNCINN